MRTGESLNRRSRGSILRVEEEREDGDDHEVADVSCVHWIPPGMHPARAHLDHQLDDEDLTEHVADARSAPRHGTGRLMGLDADQEPSESRIATTMKT